MVALVNRSSSGMISNSEYLFNFWSVPRGNPEKYATRDSLVSAILYKCYTLYLGFVFLHRGIVDKQTNLLVVVGRVISYIHTVDL
jgi:hypothetical protein